jgi:hypothetical protein
VTKSVLLKISCLWQKLALPAFVIPNPIELTQLHNKVNEMLRKTPAHADPMVKVVWLKVKPLTVGLLVRMSRKLDPAFNMLDESECSFQEWENNNLGQVMRSTGMRNEKTNMPQGIVRQVVKKTISEGIQKQGKIYGMYR